MYAYTKPGLLWPWRGNFDPIKNKLYFIIIYNIYNIYYNKYDNNIILYYYSISYIIIYYIFILYYIIFLFYFINYIFQPRFRVLYESFFL